MVRNRLFNVSIAIALIIVVAFTVREAEATAGIMSQTDAVKKAKVLECASLPPRHSIHFEYMKGLDAWVPYTEDGPAGVDGGLIYLFSSYRTCSTK